MRRSGEKHQSWENWLNFVESLSEEAGSCSSSQVVSFANTEGLQFIVPCHYHPPVLGSVGAQMKLHLEKISRLNLVVLPVLPMLPVLVVLPVLV